MARRYASRRKSYGRKTKRGAVRKRSYKRKSSGSRRMVRAPRQASGSSMDGYSVFNMPFSTYGKGNSTGIGLRMNNIATNRAHRLNTRLGAYYKADSEYRAKQAEQAKFDAEQQKKADAIANANWGVDLYNEIGTGLATAANFLIPGLGVPLQLMVSGTTPAFRQLAGGDQTFRPRDVLGGLSNLAPALPPLMSAASNLMYPGIVGITFPPQIQRSFDSAYVGGSNMISNAAANANELREIFNHASGGNYSAAKSVLDRRNRRRFPSPDIELSTFSRMGGRVTDVTDTLSFDNPSSLNKVFDLRQIPVTGGPQSGFPDIIAMPDNNIIPRTFDITNNLKNLSVRGNNLGFEPIEHRVRSRSNARINFDNYTNAPLPLIESNPDLGYRWTHPIMDPNWIPFLREPRVRDLMESAGFKSTKDQLLRKWWSEKYGDYI